MLTWDELGRLHEAIAGRVTRCQIGPVAEPAVVFGVSGADHVKLLRQHLGQIRLSFSGIIDKSVNVMLIGSMRMVLSVEVKWVLLRFGYMMKLISLEIDHTVGHRVLEWRCELLACSLLHRD